MMWNFDFHMAVHGMALSQSPKAPRIGRSRAHKDWRCSRYTWLFLGVTSPLRLGSKQLFH